MLPGFRKQNTQLSGTMLKVGIGAAVGFGAIITGLVLSRQGRHIVRDAWRTRLRPPLEHRVLDAIWSDPILGRRKIDVEEVEDGRVVLTGTVRSPDEVERARDVVSRVAGVSGVETRLDLPADELNP